MKYYIITYNGSTPGESGLRCGTEYCFVDACDVCGTGAFPKGRLKVMGIYKSKKDYFETMSGDIIISKRLKEVIRERLPNFEVDQVVNKRNQPLDFYHLYTKLSLPRFKASSSGYVTENQCPICHRDGYFNDVTIGSPTIVKPLDFRYDCEDIQNLSNAIILKTWEHWGNSRKIEIGYNAVNFARPWIVVREDLKELLEGEKVKNIHFEQIKVEGCVQQHL